MTPIQHTEKRPDSPRQEISRAAQTNPQEGFTMSKHTPTEPSSEELCNIMSELAGRVIYTVGDMYRFSTEVGIQTSEFFQTARMIAIIEAALRGGEK